MKRNYFNILRFIVLTIHGFKFSSVVFNRYYFVANPSTKGHGIRYKAAHPLATFRQSGRKFRHHDR